MTAQNARERRSVPRTAPLAAPVAVDTPQTRNSPTTDTTEGTDMTQPETISIDNVLYTRCPEPATPSEWRIVIAQRGWVFVGRYDEDGDNVTLTDAKVLRVWGTTKGLGELALSGPTAKTISDPAGTVRLHRLGVVATLDTTVTAW